MGAMNCINMNSYCYNIRCRSLGTNLYMCFDMYMNMLLHNHLYILPNRSPYSG